VKHNKAQENNITASFFISAFSSGENFDRRRYLYYVARKKEFFLFRVKFLVYSSNFSIAIRFSVDLVKFFY
jgi:hypothetical protein